VLTLWHRHLFLPDNGVVLVGLYLKTLRGQMVKRLEGDFTILRLPMGASCGIFRRLHAPFAVIASCFWEFLLL